MRRLNIKLVKGDSGDTIIEVLIALAILGLAFSISYATASRSLLLARNAQEHSEALQYLNSQVELARADAADDSLYGNDQCISTVPNDVNYGKPVPATNIACSVNNLYSLSYTYTDAKDANNIDQNVFTFTVSWPGVGSLGPQQEQISYKIHKLKPASSSASNLTPTAPPPPAPTLDFNSNPSPANVGVLQPVTLTWTSANTTSCTASGSWSGGQSLSGSTSRSFFGLGNYSFTLTCSGPGGTTGPKTITVSVSPPAPVINYFRAFPSTISQGSRASIEWDVSNATSCTASGAWSGTFGPSGFTRSQSLFYTPSTFNLSCTGSGGTVNATPSAVDVSGGSACTSSLQTQGRC